MLDQTKWTDLIVEFGPPTSPEPPSADGPPAPPPDLPVEVRERPRRPRNPELQVRTERGPLSGTPFGLNVLDADGLEYVRMVAKPGSVFTELNLLGMFDDATKIFHGKVAIITERKIGRPRQSQKGPGHV